jgi:hypothetical protein
MDYIGDSSLLNPAVGWVGGSPGLPFVRAALGLKLISVCVQT